MKDDKSSSLPFVVPMHLTAFLGFLLCLAAGLGIIYECIHTFVAEFDSLSPLARFLYHCLYELSGIALVFLFTFFVALIVISESLVHGKNRFLNTFPLLFGICLPILLALTIILVITDLHRIQTVSPIISGASPFISVIIISMSINMLGVCSTLSYHSSRKTAFAVIFFLTPLPAFVPLMVMFPAEKLISEYGYDLPLAYPRLLWVSIATAIILVAFVCTLLLTKSRAKQHTRQTALFSFGTFSYFLSFLICGRILTLYHTMMSPMLSRSQEQYFRDLKNILFIALAILWLLIALIQTMRFLVRRRKRKEISSAESSQ